MRIPLLARLLLAALTMRILDGTEGAAASATSAPDASPSSSAPTTEPTAEGNAAAPAAADASSADGPKESSDAASASSTEAGSADAPNAGASPAASSSENDTSSSAQAALPAVDTAETDAPLDDVTIVSPGTVTIDAPATNVLADPTPAVAIDVEDHAEAKERFAGLMARLHRFEDEAVAELKADMKAIATLLHLHTVASGKAEATGDYTSDDL